MKTSIFLAATVLASTCAGACRADSPLEPPRLYIAHSNNHRFFAQSNPKARTTTVYQAGARGTKPRRLWQVKGWFRALYVADDGTHAVAGYNGLSLLNLDDARPQTIVLRFLERGKLLRAVTLGDIKLDLKRLPRTASHFEWRLSEELSGGTFDLELVDGRALLFDVRTGRLSRTVREAEPISHLLAP